VPAEDELVVTKLERLAPSVSDAHDIAKELTAREVKLNLGDSIKRVEEERNGIWR
jgi:DNA invertase Pin-like site-specific DNA recombinase